MSFLKACTLHSLSGVWGASSPGTGLLGIPSLELLSSSLQPDPFPTLLSGVFNVSGTLLCESQISCGETSSKFQFKEVIYKPALLLVSPINK